MARADLLYDGEKADAIRSIYKVAENFRDGCLLQDGSLLFPGESLWTPGGLKFYNKDYAQNLKEREGKFFEKFQEQIGDSPPSVICLAAETLCVHYLFTSHTKFPEKFGRVSQVLGWAGEEFPDNHLIAKAFHGGIANASGYYNRVRWSALIFLINFATAWKGMPSEDQGVLARDPWAFREFVMGIMEPATSQMKQVLPHLLFPDTFERICSAGHRKKIIKVFADRVTEETKNEDESLLAIRRSLEEEYPGQNLDFYRSPLRELWKEEEDEEVAPSPPPAPPPSAREGSLQEAIVDLLKEVGRPMKGREIFDLLVERRYPTTAVDFYANIRYVIGHDIRENGESSTFVRLARGVYGLREWDEVSSPLPVIEDYSLDKIIEEGWFGKKEELEETQKLLARKRNLILQGPPGTGKTWLAKRLAYAFMGGKNADRALSVQFHPNMSYEDFVRGWRPSGEGRLTLVDGPVMEMIEEAQNEEVPYFLIIEEINRGNPAQIFGEMLTLMEYNKRAPAHAINLVHMREGEGPVHVPPNLYIIGTMNLADRSLAMLDFALRRRFAFVDLEPRMDEWFVWMAGRNKAPRALLQQVRDAVKSLNQEIADSRGLGKDCQIGHSFVTPEDDEEVDAEWFRRAFENEVAPLLRKYWYENPGKAEEAVKKLIDDSFEGE